MFVGIFWQREANDFHYNITKTNDKETFEAELKEVRTKPLHRLLLEDKLRLENDTARVFSSLAPGVNGFDICFFPEISFLIISG